MKTKRCVVLFIFLCICTVLIIATDIYAEDLADSYSKDYEGMKNSIDGDIAKYLPDGVLSSESAEDELNQAVSELSSFDYIAAIIGEILAFTVKDTLSLVFSICGLLVLSSVLGALADTVSSNSLSKALSLICGLAITAAIITLQYPRFEYISQFFDNMSNFMKGLIPLMCTVYAVGGNINTATVSGAALMLFIDIFQNFYAKTLFSVIGICFACAICSAVTPMDGFSSISKFVKKTYGFILSLIMIVFTALFSAQSELAAAADNAATKATKYMVGSFVPVVGGTAGESLKVLSSSVGYLKTNIGVLGIIVIIIILLPVLLTLSVTRLAYIFCEAVAKLLGCKQEAELLNEIGGIYGFIIAVVFSSSILFIYTVVLFIKCTVAVSS